MWTSKKSVTLSLIMIYCFATALAVLAAAAPWLFPLYIRATGKPETLTVILLVTFYCCVPAGVAALYVLWRLLRNIRNGAVFVRDNITCLRVLSWCCFWTAVICLGGCFFYTPFGIISVAAFFFGLILRVIKNVFVCASQLKEENDLTI